jgi:hypothetical protein
MQTFTITSLLTLALAALSTAAPAERRQFEAQLTFYGAAGASYTLSVPTDASEFYIGKLFLLGLHFSPALIPLFSLCLSIAILQSNDANKQ